MGIIDKWAGFNRYTRHRWNAEDGYELATMYASTFVGAG